MQPRECLGQFNCPLNDTAMTDTRHFIRQNSQNAQHEGPLGNGDFWMIMRSAWACQLGQTCPSVEDGDTRAAVGGAGRGSVETPHGLLSFAGNLIYSKVRHLFTR